ncbi:type I-E CRISPR-associated protein Cse1/CasA [Corynebacterium freneyi]|uniref:type I-E CRISPR-associated protein Cse1/CasA n=1 Tax=Corynebacterium freneyi TaxID=134034 RepID=UPI001CCEE89B|nr:type I-E CRISPR-associated protein Cse1/CasA [Corynebacterium freneyi]UBI02232.1 type I-E CRISPR-associated protein Cse1/CasA [Corynebacterium freneyi]
MTVNALTDVAFLKAASGRSSVREMLLGAHQAGTRLDLSMPGYVVSSQLRLLAAVTAVALRHCPEQMDDAAANGLPESAVDLAIADLSPASDPFDKEFPFLQRPALTPSDPKDSARRLGPNQQPVKKLSPAMPPDEAEAYWNLLTQAETELPLPDALLALTVFHHMSMAGNNAYDGDKCQMGSPAMRYVGADFTATEVFLEGPRLLDTLLALIPRSWVDGDGLPAWADRLCERSVDEQHGQAHPLWAATWSSNAPACHWEGTQLTGVRTGGIPEAWYLRSEMGTTKQDRKDWWDDRNTRDPFYLYMQNHTGELKVQRLDFGVDGTHLAVEWAAENKMEALLARVNGTVARRPADDHQVLFARHQISGTASSPNIRASEIFAPATDRWSFDIDEEVRADIQGQANTIQHLNNILRSSFRRRAKDQKDSPVLDDLEGRRDDASAAFWREITGVYIDIIAELRDHYTNIRDAEHESAGYELPDSLKRQVLAATLRAFDDTVAPHSLQEPAHIAFVRGALERRIRNALNRNDIAEENQ